jgi:hypothetical protein
MKPTKERLREWQQENRKAHRPPVAPEQARKELGWDLIEANRKDELRINTPDISVNNLK